MPIAVLGLQGWADAKIFPNWDANSRYMQPSVKLWCPSYMKYVLITLCIFVLTSCNEENVSNGVKLRLENVSTIDFTEVYVATTGAEKSFGSLNKGEVSEYISFDGIYRYAYVRIVAGDNEYILQPIDYVGETLLTSGKYTYLLNITNEADPWSVSLEFRKD